MHRFDDYRWLTSPEGLRAWKGLVAELSDVSLGGIRSACGCDEVQARMLREQWEFSLDRARRKVLQPQQWLWTSRLLEQASDEETSRETARDIPESMRVVDGCCGAGVDAIQIARRGAQVVAVDRDEVACLLAGANAALQQMPLEVRAMELEACPLSPETFLQADPDRRAGGTRTIHPEQMSPSWSVLASRIAQSAGASIKMAPGFRPDPNFAWGSPGPPHAIRWLSRVGSVRQQRWYWNVDRWPMGARILSQEVMPDAWHHEVFAPEAWKGIELREIAREDSPIQEYVADQDPGVRAAELHGALAVRLGVNVLGGGMGYYQAPRPVPHPLVRWFRVLERMPMDRKKIRAAARRWAPRTWELKSRGVDCDLQKLQRELTTHTDSIEELTLLLTRVGPRHIAIFAQRWSHDELSDKSTSDES